MERFCIRLEALDPAHGRFRAYRIDAGTDLLGDWLVDVTYGRIGSQGRTIRHLASGEADARRIVRRCLQRRATAPKRIGVPYQLRELADPGQWLSPQPQHQRQRPIQPQERFIVNGTNTLADTLTWQGEQLIDHDLRDFPQPIGGRGSQRQPEQRSVNEFSR